MEKRVAEAALMAFRGKVELICTWAMVLEQWGSNGLVDEWYVEHETTF